MPRLPPPSERGTSRRAQSWARRVLVPILAVVAAALVAELWVYRVELFVIPARWREVREAREGHDEEGRRELAEAVTRLIQLQDPEFAGGSRFRLQEIPTSPGVILVCYQNSEGERLPHPGAGTTLVESLPFHHRFLTAEGALFVPDSGCFVGHGERANHWKKDEDEPPWPEKSGLYYEYTRGTMSIHFTRGPFLYTWDARGFVPHGEIRDDDYSTPGLDEPESAPQRFDPEYMRQLFDSGSAGDTLRALSLYRRGKVDEPELLQTASTHGDPDVRARALGFLQPGPENRSILLRALEDSSPRVRLTALFGYAASSCRNWRATMGGLAVDPDPVISRWALRYLVGSACREVAAAALRRLVERRESLDFVAPSSLGRLSSRELAEELVEWLESGDALAVEPLASLSPEHVRPFAGRLREVYRRDPERDWLELCKFLSLLLGLEDPDLDGLLFAPAGPDFETLLLRGPWEPGIEILLEALGSRRRPGSAAAYEKELVSQLDFEGFPAAAAATILYRWGVPGERRRRIQVACAHWGDFAEAGGEFYRELLADPVFVESALAEVLEPDYEGALEFFELLGPLARFDRPPLAERLVPGLREVVEDEPLMAKFLLSRWGAPEMTEGLHAFARGHPDDVCEAIATCPELLESAAIREVAMEWLGDSTDGRETSEVHFDETGSFFEMLHAARRRPSPGLTEFLRSLSRNDGFTGVQAAHRLTLWNVPGSRERLVDILKTSCFHYGWPAGRYGALPEDVLEELGELE